MTGAAVARSAIPVRALKPERVRVGWLTLGVLLHCGILVAYSAKANDEFFLALSGLIIVYGVALCAISLYTFLLVIPFNALMGIAARYQFQEQGAAVNVSDAFVLILLLGLVFRQRRFTLGASTRLILLAYLGMLLSWLVSGQLSELIFSVLTITQYLIVMWAVFTEVRSREAAWNLLAAWCVATTICSAMVIRSYFAADFLLLNMSAEYRLSYAELLRSGHVLYRATYFIAQFIFPLGMTILCCLFALMKKKGGATLTFLAFASLLINLVAIVLMGNRTVLVSILVPVVGFSFFQGLRTGRISRLQALPIAALCIALLAGTIIAAVMPENQLNVYLDRTTDPESLRLRAAVWSNVIPFVFSEPSLILFGMGPDASIRLSRTDKVMALYATGRTLEGALDNSYLYLLFDYGVPVTIVLLVLGARAIRLTWRSGMGSIERMDLEAFLFGILAVVAVMGLTQQYAASKAGFYFIQAIAMAECTHYLTSQSDRRASGRTVRL
ncbi:MAG: O-antigen ligase family protein [Bryobacteraceae bacterium]|nr:O-antigen ligase family protein [Bryobacteraceae bacterium]